MNYELFQASAVKAFGHSRDIKAMVSDIQQVLSVVPSIVRNNERLDRERAELKQENAALKAELDDWKGNAEGFEPDAYMRLPLDADGVAIRPGDKIYFDGDPESEALICIAIGCWPLPVEFMDWGETGTTAWEDGDVFTHRRPKPEPADSWEKLGEDAMKTTCTYFGMSKDKSAYCSACPYGREATGRGCGKNMRLDLVERAKRLAGIEEQEGGERTAIADKEERL